MRMTISRLLEKMVPDPQQCRAAAHELREKYPHETAEQLAQRAIWHARQSAMAVGAVTGVVSSPLTMVPAALADMAAMLRLEGVMAGTIAALFEPQTLDDHSIESDIATILFPGAVSQVLRQVGVRAGERATKNLIRKHVTEGALQTVMKVAAKHLGLDLTRNAIVEKTVPLVGAGIGAGWNWLEIGAVGNRAIRYYKGEPLRVQGDGITTVAARQLNSAAHHVGSAVKRITAKVRTARRPGSVPALPAPGDGEAAD